jgi:hypothetical protein
MVSLCRLFTLMLPISSFSYDELARWDKYAAALPVSRRGVVGSKYLLALILGCIAELLIVATALVLALLKNAAPGEVLLTGLACVGVGLLMNSILLPSCCFNSGAGKGPAADHAVLALLFQLGLAWRSCSGRTDCRRSLLTSRCRFSPPIWPDQVWPCMFPMVSL